VARSPERDALLERLVADGIGCAVHYPVPDHQQPALARQAFRQADLGETELACRQVLSLPCFPELTDEEVALVIAAVERAT
jgi:dTDP-3-amino-2,3,6-trideoxy-4-keto-D-glucose/dTDP-3-amino-3,4,6-trideoxy-alpha-D-glucose/dTDP-2,6-dideoxy-D-kanosamine transaminase